MHDMGSRRYARGAVGNATRINFAACMLMHTAEPDSGRLTKPCSNGPKECEGQYTQHLHEHQR